MPRGLLWLACGSMAVRRRLAARRFRPARVKSESHGVGCCWGVGATEGLYTAVSVNGTCHPIKFCCPLTLLSRCVGVFTGTKMSTEVARLQAQAEEVTLRLADNKTGYFGVYLTKPGQPKPYLAQVKRGGRKVYLGMFATTEEAALCVARSPEGQAAAGRAAAAMSRGAWLPAVPSGAIPREKGTAPAMAPSTEPVVKVEALLLLLDDDIALDECIGRHGRDDDLLVKEEEGSEDVRPKRQRIWNEFF